MKRLLDAQLSYLDGDYADIRFEILQRTRIEWRGEQLREAAVGVCDGFVIRLLKDGGFASVAVTRSSDLERALRDLSYTVESMHRKSCERVSLKVPEAITQEIIPSLSEDPRKVSMEEKIALARYYNGLVLGVKGVASSTALYEETIRDRYFLNSDGSFIREPLITCSITLRIAAEGCGTLQNGRAVVSSSDGFSKLRGRDDLFKEKARVVRRLLEAEPVTAGTYDVVLNQEMTGVFIHEAIGHYSEADLIVNNPAIREKMRIGAELGSPVLSICDDPTMPEQIGRYSYDDEGVACRKVQLMRQGILTGRLHSMKTAAMFSEPLTGHAVAEDTRYAPLVRMGCIYAEAGALERDELFQMAGDGLYVLDSKGGQTSGENFTLGAQYGFLIKKGRPAAMVRDINLTGNLFSTLRSVEAVGCDLKISESGGCGKGQMNIRSAMGGPHILIRNLRVGGR